MSPFIITYSNFEIAKIRYGRPFFRAGYFLFVLFLIIGNKSKCQDTIHWTPGYKLQWKDFKGKPDASSPYSALTTSGVTFNYRFSDTSFKFTVVSAFYKQLSW